MNTPARIPDFGAEWREATMDARVMAQLTPHDTYQLQSALDESKSEIDRDYIIASLAEHLDRAIAVGDRMVAFLEPKEPLEEICDRVSGHAS